MQSITVYNARTTAVAIRGFRSVPTASAASGVLDQITFDDDYYAYINYAAKAGIAILDGVTTPVGYQAVTSATSVLAASRFLACTGAGAPYALTLCAASAVPAGTSMYFYFISGASAVNITRAGSDTIDGGTAVIGLDGSPKIVRLTSDGVSAWVSG